MSKKLIFTKAFDYRPSAEPRITKAFLPSKDPQTVNSECAERAIACGAAYEPVTKTKSKSD